MAALGYHNSSAVRHGVSLSGYMYYDVPGLVQQAFKIFLKRVGLVGKSKLHVIHWHIAKFNRKALILDILITKQSESSSKAVLGIIFFTILNFNSQSLHWVYSSTKILKLTLLSS